MFSGTTSMDPDPAPAGRALPARVRPPAFGCPLIARENVHRALAAGGVAVLAAPAGAGKTAALAQWAGQARAAGRRVAWLTLTADDNDVPALTSALVAALRADAQGETALAAPPPAAAHRDDTAAGASAFTAAAAVMDEVERRPDDVVLVLDDVQQLHRPAALEVLDALARFRSPQLCLVLAGRYEPSLRLSRMRLDGTLRTLAADELAFGADGAAELLAQHGVRLGSDDLHALLARTEGWAAGLRMAAMMLAGRADVSACIAEFSGDNRTVADYLAGEILGSLPQEERTFLVATAHEESFSLDYAREVGGRPDAARILERLIRSNCMVHEQPGPEPRYSYHPLLRSYLVAESARLPSDVRARIHARAATWLAAEGSPMPALEHAVAAGGTDAELSERFAASGIAAVAAGQSEALLAFLATLPETAARLPGAALAGAAASLDLGDAAAADVALGRYRARDAGPVARAAEESVRLQRTLWSGAAPPGADPPSPAGPIRPAPARPGPSPAAAQATDGHELIDAHRRLGRGWLLLIRGDRAEAVAELERSAALARSSGGVRTAMSAMSALAMAAVAADTVVAMDERSSVAVEYARAHGLLDDPSAVTAHQVAAWVAYQRCEYDDAERSIAAAGRAEGPGVLPALQTLTRGLDAVITLDRAERPYRAATALHDVVRTMDWSRMPARATGCALLIQLRTALRVGELNWAHESLALAERLVPGTLEAELVRIGLRLQQGRADAAREQLQAALAEGLPALTRRVPVDALVLAAALAESAGDHARAHREMARALDAARPDTLVRPFRDGGPVVAGILAAGLGRFGHFDEFAALVLARIGAAGGPHPVLLTARELELLVELPSMRTTEEIAESLFVSVNTVKTHLRSIYRKLDVRSRRDAVDAARAIGLL